MSKFVQSKDVAWNFLGDKIIAFNLSGEKQFHEFNETAATVFKTLQSPVSRQELVDALLEEFDVNETHAAQDVDQLLGEMQTKRLITAV